MPRYIDAEKIPYSFDVVPNADPRKSYFKATADKRDIDKLPTISPDEVRGVGEWIPHGDCGVTECSACKWSIEEYVEYNYCPNCGAKMEVSEDA